MFCSAAQALNSQTMSPSFKLLDYVNADFGPMSMEGACFPNINQMPNLNSFAPDHIAHQPNFLALSMSSNPSDSNLYLNSTPSPHDNQRINTNSPQVPVQSQMSPSNGTSQLSPANSQVPPPLNINGQSQLPPHQLPSQISFNAKSAIIGNVFSRQPKSMPNFINGGHSYPSDLNGYNYNDELMNSNMDDQRSVSIEDSTCSDMSEAAKYASVINPINQHANRSAPMNSLQMSNSSAPFPSFNTYGHKFVNQPVTPTNFGPLTTFQMEMMQQQPKNEIEIPNNFNCNISPGYPPKSLSSRRSSGRRPAKKEEGLSPEEEERRRIRRERNKQAAARCRKRRVDHTNQLEQETEQLEESNNQMQKEIQDLQKQVEQLEYILNQHDCRVPQLSYP